MQSQSGLATATGTPGLALRCGLWLQCYAHKLGQAAGRCRFLTPATGQTPNFAQTGPGHW